MYIHACTHTCKCFNERCTHTVYNPPSPQAHRRSLSFILLLLLLLTVFKYPVEVPVNLYCFSAQQPVNARFPLPLIPPSPHPESPAPLDPRGMSLIVKNTHRAIQRVGDGKGWVKTVVMGTWGTNRNNTIKYMMHMYTQCQNVL